MAEINFHEMEQKWREYWKNRKTYDCFMIINSSMPPSDPKWLSDEFFEQKTYKHRDIRNISSLRIVSMIPGDRKVAGCLYFLNDLKGFI